MRAPCSRIARAAQAVLVAEHLQGRDALGLRLLQRALGLLQPLGHVVHLAAQHDHLGAPEVVRRPGLEVARGDAPRQGRELRQGLAHQRAHQPERRQAREEHQREALPQLRAQPDAREQRVDRVRLGELQRHWPLRLQRDQRDQPLVAHPDVDLPAQQRRPRGGAAIGQRQAPRSRGRDQPRVDVGLGDGAVAEQRAGGPHGVGHAVLAREGGPQRVGEEATVAQGDL